MVSVSAAPRKPWQCPDEIGDGSCGLCWSCLKQGMGRGNVGDATFALDYSSIGTHVAAAHEKDASASPAGRPMCSKNGQLKDANQSYATTPKRKCQWTNVGEVTRGGCCGGQFFLCCF